MRDIELDKALLEDFRGSKPGFCDCQLRDACDLADEYIDAYEAAQARNAVLTEALEAILKRCDGAEAYTTASYAYYIAYKAIEVTREEQA